LLINAILISIGLLVVYEGVYFPLAVVWESIMYPIIPITILSVYLLFDFMKNEILKKRTIFLAVLLILLSTTPWLLSGFFTPEIPEFPGTSSLSMTLFHGTAIGIMRDNKFYQNVPTVKQGELIVFLFPNLAGFRKNNMNLYETEVKMYTITKDGKISSAYFNPIDDLVKDYPGRDFGIIPGNFGIPINSSSLPIGNITLNAVVTDKVSKAYIDNEYSFELLKN